MGPTFTFELSGGLSSTLHDITSLSASIKHRHNTTRVDTSVNVMVSKALKKWISLIRS